MSTSPIKKDSSKFIARKRRSWRRGTGFLATVFFFKRDLSSLMAWRRMVQSLYFGRVFGGFCILSQSGIAGLSEMISGRPWVPAFVFMLGFSTFCFIALIAFLESETTWAGRLRPHKTLFWAIPLIFSTFAYLLSLVLFMRMGYVAVWAVFPRFDLLALNWTFIAAHTALSVVLCWFWQKFYESKLDKSKNQNFKTLHND